MILLSPVFPLLLLLTPSIQITLLFHLVPYLFILRIISYVQNDFFSVVFNSSKGLSADSFSPRNSPLCLELLSMVIMMIFLLRSGLLFLSCYTTLKVINRPILFLQTQYYYGIFYFNLIPAALVRSPRNGSFILQSFNPRLTVDFKSSPVGLLRFVPLTLIPESFDHSSLILPPLMVVTIKSLSQLVLKQSIILLQYLILFLQIKVLVSPV